jgi:hypothetical protein
MLPISNNVNARLTYGFGPPFEVPMYEIFSSCGTSLMWCYNGQRMKHELHREDSVPLAIANDVREGIPDLVDSHFTFVLDHCLGQLPQFYYDEVGMNKLQADLLGLICNYYKRTRGQVPNSNLKSCHPYPDFSFVRASSLGVPSNSFCSP